MLLSNQQILNAMYLIAPQFANPDSDSLEIYNEIIDLLRCEVNEVAFCGCARLAWAYLLAHTLATRLNPMQGVSSGLHEGDLSIQYAISADASILNSTSYGKAYLDLINRTITGPTVTNLPQNFSIVGYGYGSCGCD